MSGGRPVAGRSGTTGRSRTWSRSPPATPLVGQARPFMPRSTGRSSCDSGKWASRPIVEVRPSIRENREIGRFYALPTTTPRISFSLKRRSSAAPSDEGVEPCSSMVPCCWQAPRRPPSLPACSTSARRGPTTQTGPDSCGTSCPMPLNSTQPTTRSAPRNATGPTNSREPFTAILPGHVGDDRTVRGGTDSVTKVGPSPWLTVRI